MYMVMKKMNIASYFTDFSRIQKGGQPANGHGRPLSMKTTGSPTNMTPKYSSYSIKEHNDVSAILPHPLAQ